MNDIAPAAAGSPECILCLENLGKDYQVGPSVVHAMIDVNLCVRHGSFWSIMGASGSGKSTLLNILGCLDRPTSGRYILDGTDVGGLDDDQRSDIRLHRIGFVFQNFNLVPQLSVQENIELPLYYQGRDANACAAKAVAMAEMVGLEDRLKHRPVELSGGQRQRVAIARALANEPAVILADEPTGNLDSRTGGQIMDLLGRLNAEGRTIMLVTHEADIAAHAQHRLHMQDGRAEVQAEGSA